MKLLDIDISLGRIVAILFKWTIATILVTIFWAIILLPILFILQNATS